MVTWSVSINQTTPERPFTFLDLQALQNEAILNEKPTLIFAEVEPVITLGQRQVAWNQLPPSLGQSPVQVVAGERGGNETWHGPGQWICFMVAPLEQWVGDSKGIKKAMDQTLTCILPVIQEFVPDAHIEEGDRLGIWSEVGKLVSIGIKIQNGWMKSGFAVNVAQNESSFQGVNPCGLNARPDFIFNYSQNSFTNIPSKLVAALSLKK